MVNPAWRLFLHSLTAPRAHSAVRWLHGVDCVSSLLAVCDPLLLLSDLGEVRSYQRCHGCTKAEACGRESDK